MPIAQPQSSVDNNGSQVQLDNNEPVQDEAKLQLDLPTIEREQHKDHYYKHLIAFLTKQTQPIDRNILHKVLSDQSIHIMKDNILYYLHRPKAHKNFQKDWETHIVIPKSLVPNVLYSCHDSKLNGGHYATAKTIQRLYENKVNWRTMHIDAINHVKTCGPCLEYKTPRLGHPPFMKYDVTRGFPMESISIDSYGMLVTTPQGHSHLLGVLCRYSRFLILIPLKTLSAHEIATKLHTWTTHLWQCQIHMD